MKKRAAVKLAVVILLLDSAAANAYMRAKDSGSGACLWWANRNVAIYFNQACNADVAPGDCELAVRKAFSMWGEPDCSDFAFSVSSTNRTDVGFDQEHQENNINLLIWKESDWPYEPSNITVPTVSYDISTGEIVDVDIELNGVDFEFSTTDSPTDTLDIQSVLAYCSGRTLGLDYSTDPNSVMYGTISPGNTSKRILATDDINGLCAIYPTGRNSSNCLAPQDEGSLDGGLDGQDDPGTSDANEGGGGCSCGGLNDSSLGCYPVLGLWIFFFSRARRPNGV